MCEKSATYVVPNVEGCIVESKKFIVCCEREFDIGFIYQSSICLNCLVDDKRWESVCNVDFDEFCSVVDICVILSKGVDVEGVGAVFSGGIDKESEEL